MRPYPGPGPATLVSDAGGFGPLWSPDGGGLYYLGPEGDPPHPALMTVDIEVGDELHVGRAVPLIDPWRYDTTIPIRSPDVAADGSFIARRGLRDADFREGTRVNRERIADRVEQIHVVLNWFEELRERVPAR